MILKHIRLAIEAIEEYFQNGGKSVINEGEPNERNLTMDILLKRFQQFFEESERLVDEVAKAFDAADLGAIGPPVARSQLLTDTHLNNQVQETRDLAKFAVEVG